MQRKVGKTKVVSTISGLMHVKMGIGLIWKKSILDNSKHLVLPWHILTLDKTCKTAK